jgi:hypothetical protein
VERSTVEANKSVLHEMGTQTTVLLYFAVLGLLVKDTDGIELYSPLTVVFYFFDKAAFGGLDWLDC